MKRIISFLLAVILLASLVVSVIPANALAAEVAPVHVFDQDGNEVWSGNANVGDLVNEWLDANAASAIAKEGFTADKWYNKDAGVKFDDAATFNGWTNVMVKYEAVETNNDPEPNPNPNSNPNPDPEPEPEKVPVHVFDQDGKEIWTGEAIKGALVTGWLETNAAEEVAKDGFIVDKWFNKDSGVKFSSQDTFNGWTNVMVKYYAEATEPETTEPEVTEPENKPNNGGAEEPKTHIVKFYLNSAHSSEWTVTVAHGATVSAAEVANAAYRVSTASGYTFEGWSFNGSSDVLTNSNAALITINSDNCFFAPVFSKNATNKFAYPVYLNIYKDTMVGSPDKSVEITNTIAVDGIVSYEEARKVVAEYYLAKNSYGVNTDGLYLAKGNWVSDYVNNTSKYEAIDAGTLRQTGPVYINVMITNAVSRTGTKADPTLPKTGDSIYGPVAVMGISAIALASLFYVYNKKRYAM